MRLLAESSAPAITLRNRFEVLSDELTSAEEGEESQLMEEASTTAEISGVQAVARPLEHDLLRLEGKINGRRATFLIDCGSTHDFISSDFVKQYRLPTSASEEVLTVSLADGSTTSQALETTDKLKVVVGGFSEQQSFTVFPLSRYDVILGKPWLFRNNPAIDFRTNKVGVGSQVLDAYTGTGADECMFMSGKQARRELRRGSKGFLAWISTADHQQATPVPTPRIEVSGERAAEMQQLLKEFRDQLPENLPDSLPPKRFVDHEIQLEAGGTPPSRGAYRLPKPELDEMQVQLTKLLQKGFIEPSKSPFGAPVFFVKKTDGTLRMVCDWRDLNRITVKNKACLPNVDDLFDAIQGSTYFSKLDLHSGYNQIRIREEDVPKTAINTPFGHFQFRVMGFGLTNAPATFQSMMNDILRPYLRKFAVVFLDDILIFSKTWEDHLAHVRTILTALKEHQLFCKLLQQLSMFLARTT